MCGTHLGRALGRTPKGVVPFSIIFLSFFSFLFPLSLFHVVPNYLYKSSTMKQLITSNELINDAMHGMHGSYCMQDKLM